MVGGQLWIDTNYWEITSEGGEGRRRSGRRNEKKSHRGLFVGKKTKVHFLPSLRLGCGVKVKVLATEEEEEVCLLRLYDNQICHVFKLEKKPKAAKKTSVLLLVSSGHSPSVFSPTQSSVKLD